MFIVKTFTVFHGIGRVINVIWYSFFLIFDIEENKYFWHDALEWAHIRKKKVCGLKELECNKILSFKNSLNVIEEHTKDYGTREKESTI